MRKNLQRAIIEVAFIVFLFYTNLLMGEFIHGAPGQTMGFIWALENIFTASNFLIAIIAGFIGYVVFEYLRKKL